MAKKKTKVTVKKKVKKSNIPDVWRKISIISSKVRGLDCSGTSEEEYCYTTASYIFKVFNELFAEYNLVPMFDFGPIKDVIQGCVAGCEVVCYLSVYDMDSKQTAKLGHATGRGFNECWACNSAQTVAKKLVLQYAFNASWIEPEGLKYAEEVTKSCYLSQAERDKLRAEAEDAAGEAFRMAKESFAQTVQEVVTKAAPVPQMIKIKYPLPDDMGFIQAYVIDRQNKGDSRNCNAIVNQLASFLNIKKKEDWPNTSEEYNRAMKVL